MVITKKRQEYILQYIIERDIKMSNFHVIRCQYYRVVTISFSTFLHVGSSRKTPYGDHVAATIDDMTSTCR